MPPFFPLFSGALLLLACCEGLKAGSPAVILTFGPLAQSQGSGVLRVVLPELEGVIATLQSSQFDDTPRVTFELDDLTSTVQSQEACTHTLVASTHARVTCGGLLGLAYAMHDLREALALSSTPTSTRYIKGGVPGVIRALGEGALRAAPSPTYTTRAWSEEGQFLDLPDRGYYTPGGGAADVGAIAQECAALEAEVVPALLRLRMNALIVLHSDIEDYVTYDTLPNFLPGAPQIYPSNSSHRVRRSGIVSVMAPWIAHLKGAYGIDFFFQVYELSSPPGVCNPSSGTLSAVNTNTNINSPPLLNCSLHSPAVPALLNAKYTELKAALPALAGIFVTVEDSWTPRASYEFSVLWTAQVDLPKVVTLFHDALATASLRLVFRLWVFGEPVNWKVLIDNSPPSVEFSIKQTQGDFLLDYPINDLLKCTPTLCPPKDRRVIVEVDAFRQYNGWTSGVCFMGEQWGPRLEEARESGVVDMWGWGSWAPGCTWPDSGPTLLNVTPTDPPYKSWRGWWDTYRMFNGTESNGGFSLGGQSNAYLLYRLSWDAPPANATAIALDFGALYYGAPNAAAIGALLAASIHAWLPTSSPSVGDFALFWTMMQHDHGDTFGGIARMNVTLAQFQAAANASEAAVGDMEAALERVVPSAIPPTNPLGYAGAVRAVGVSKAYLAALFAWRSAGLAVALLGEKPTPSACNDTLALIADLGAKVAVFDGAYPIESASWVVGRLDKALESYPPFLQSVQRTMGDFVEPWETTVKKTCGL